MNINGSTNKIPKSAKYCMRDIIDKLDKVIVLEGGNIWKNELETIRIDRQNVVPTVQFLEKITGLKLVDNMLGTTGRKESSGDLDLAVDAKKVDKASLQNRLDTWAKANDPNALTKKTGVSVHFRTPINGNPKNGYVQTDFMFLDDIPFAKWSMAQQLSSFPGSARHIIMASVAKSLGLKWSFQQGLVDRNTNQVLPKGRDANYVAKTLFGPKANANTLTTVENMLSALENDPKRDEKLADAYQALGNELAQYKKSMINESIVVTEASRGLLFRSKGDRFFKGKQDSPESVLIFDKVNYFPSQPGAYNSHEEMMQAYQEIENKYPNVMTVNTPTRAMKAFAIITLVDEQTQQPVYTSRFFSEIKPNMAGAWKNNELTSVPGEYQLEKETSLKSTYKLKPSDLFDAPARFGGANSLLRAFESSPTAQPFVPGFKMLYEDPPQFPTFENAGQYLTAIRDDLGETIGPVAMIKGLPMGSGVDEATKDLLNGGDWSDSAISFPGGKTNNLIDSYLITKSGVEIGISSKGASGANASVKNVFDGIDFIRKKGTDEQKELLEKYKDQVQLLTFIATASTISFPIDFAYSKSWIERETGDWIRHLIKTGAKDLQGVDPLAAKQIEKLVLSKGAKTDLPNYNIGYHALAALAYKTAEFINNDPKFSEACLKFLNSSPIVQLHMSVTKQKDNDVKVTGFTSTYPPKFKGSIKIDPGKNYASTSASGRLTFTYDDKPSQEPVTTTEPSFLQKAKDIAMQKIGFKRKLDKPEVKGVGREKR